MNIDGDDGQNYDVENNVKTDACTIHGNQQNDARKIEEKLEQLGNIWQKMGLGGRCDSREQPMMKKHLLH